MGQNARAQSLSGLSLNLTNEEIKTATQRFNLLDKGGKGHITVNDLRRYFRVSLAFDCVYSPCFPLEFYLCAV